MVDARLAKLNAEKARMRVARRKVRARRAEKAKRTRVEGYWPDRGNRY